MLFIDPRHHNLPYGTAAALKALPRPIDFPHSVATGSDKKGWTYHFLGSNAGAQRAADELRAKGHEDVSMGLLFHVFKTDEPLTLTEAGARFLSAHQAISLGRPDTERVAPQAEMALG